MSWARKVTDISSLIFVTARRLGCRCRSRRHRSRWKRTFGNRGIIRPSYDRRFYPCAYLEPGGKDRRLRVDSGEQHSQFQLFGNGQGGSASRLIFLWCWPFFYAAEKPEKSGKPQKIVQKLYRDHMLDTWVNEKNRWRDANWDGGRGRVWLSPKTTIAAGGLPAAISFLSEADGIRTRNPRIDSPVR